MLFSRRTADLEVKNRILTDASRKRAQRIEELERELQEYERVKSERVLFPDRVTQLEEHNRQLTESAAKQALRVQELERELLAARTEIATKDFPRVEAERAFYLKRVGELEENNRQLTESATKYALRVQKLERAIGTRLPDFEGDDGTVEFAKACGIYIAVVEAPVSEDRKSVV